MNSPTFLANARRTYDTIMAHFGVRGGSTKHDHYRDFGWPENLTFQQFHRMYCRNSLAAAGVDKTIAKTWQDNPEIWESEKPSESTVESAIRQRFEDLRIWRAVAEADRRAMVGGYAGFIIRFRDSKPFSAPVEGNVRGGLDGLAGILPFWASQMNVIDWNQDEASEGYGEPAMYQFSEFEVGTGKPGRAIKVHPDRVIIWSEDGTTFGRSALEPGFNDLIDLEKIKGAGGEGFWKTARGAPILEAPPGLNPNDMARTMGVQTPDLLNKVNAQVDDFQTGFDKALMLGGLSAKPLQINLPSPEHFFAGPVNSYAASMSMPVKILMGSQTGERASTEDAREWAQTCHSRRVNICRPLIRQFINRLELFGVIPAIDWHVEWSDLTEATSTERMATAGQMADINAKTNAVDLPPFTSVEIRVAAGYSEDPEHLKEDPREDDEEDDDETKGENLPGGEDDEEDPIKREGNKK